MPTVKNLPYGDIGATLSDPIGPVITFSSLSSSHTSLQSFRTDVLVFSMPSFNLAFPPTSPPFATPYSFAWGCPNDPAPWTTITLRYCLVSLQPCVFTASAIVPQQILSASRSGVSGSPSLTVMAAPPSFTMTSTVPSAGGTLRSHHFIGAFARKATVCSVFRFFTFLGGMAFSRFSRAVVLCAR